MVALAANAFLLLGLLWLDWSPETIAFLFWFEAAVIGTATAVRIAASLPGEALPPGQRNTYLRLPRAGGRTRVSSTVPRVHPVLALPLFLLLYGLLLLAYGALLAFSLKAPDPWRLAAAALEGGGVRLAMGVIAAEHLWTFWRDFVRGPAWQRTDPTFHFWRPFGLAMLAWLGFVLGFLVLGWLHSPLTVLAVLIVLKAVAEFLGATIDAQAGPWQRRPPEAGAR